MLPILQRELADQREWLTEEELMDYYAIGQCTPGIIALNVATFTGRKRGGDLGGVVATAGFILPSLCIIIALAGVITSVEHLKWVQNAFAGIRACICVQILNAVIKKKNTRLTILSGGCFYSVYQFSSLVSLTAAPLSCSNLSARTVRTGTSTDGHTVTIQPGSRLEKLWHNGSVASPRISAAMPWPRRFTVASRAVHRRKNASGSIPWPRSFGGWRTSSISTPMSLLWTAQATAPWL